MTISKNIMEGINRTIFFVNIVANAGRNIIFHTLIFILFFDTFLLTVFLLN